MGYALRDGVSFCEVNAQLIFLDTRADRYFCLDALREAEFRALIEKPGHQAVPPRLQDAGLLIETPGAGHVAACPPAYAQASVFDDTQPLRLDRPLLDALVRLALVRRSLRRGGLGRILHRLRRAKSRLPEFHDSALPELARLARDFERTARLVRSHDQCLSRSIVLTQIALSRGLAADLVIGVRLNPFAAHSWVQAGSHVLNDRMDSVRTYTPVLVL